MYNLLVSDTEKVDRKLNYYIAWRFFFIRSLPLPSY